MSEKKIPRTKRQELGDRSRDEILNAALSMISMFGYDGATVSRIAKASGLPSSSIYWHFGSKAGVMTAVMERGAERFFDMTSDSGVAALRAEDPFVQLRADLDLARRSVEANPEFFRTLFLLTLSEVEDEGIMSHIREVTDRGKQQLHHVIEVAFHREGSEAALKIADTLVDFSQGAFDGAFLAAQTHKDVSFESLIGQLADTIIALGSELAAAQRN